MLLHDYLGMAAERAHDRVAVVAGGERTSFGELSERSSRVARALAEQGIERGDRVAIFGDNGIEVVIAVWAALQANAVFMVLSPQLKAHRLAWILRDSGARALIASARLAPVIAAAAAEAPSLETILTYGGPVDLAVGQRVIAWEDVLRQVPKAPPPRRCIDLDLASIIYTSGSTGDPKGVMLTHLNMTTAATSITTYLGAAADDVVLSALPLAFDYGLYQILMAARVGARVVLEKGFAYPAAMLERIAEERVTAFPVVPTMVAMMLPLGGEAFDLSSVRYLTNTAAALPLAHIPKLRAMFPQAKIFSMYGLTECKRCTYLPPEDLDKKPGSVGIAIPNTELWVEDAAGNRVGPGQVGELVIRGATVMRGYWNHPEETAKKLRPGPLPGELVLHTGDLCRLDEDGYLYFVARTDDVIKSRGEKVAPREIEDVLYALPGVREAAVVGVPHPVLGQAPKAVVVLAEGRAYSEAEILAHCRARLEPFKVPLSVELRAALPRTDTGKIKKTDLV